MLPIRLKRPLESPMRRERVTDFRERFRGRYGCLIGKFGRSHQRREQRCRSQISDREAIGNQVARGPHLLCQSIHRGQSLCARDLSAGRLFLVS